MVRHALTGSSLLFLGFPSRTGASASSSGLIVSQEGAARRKRFPHAAVQVDPEGSQLIDPGEARKYLMDCYGSDDISLYWGGGDDFLRDLAPRLPVRTPAEWDQDGGEDDDF